jgi:microcystin-dependent protein
MAQPYVGEIRMFAGNFAPAGWMFCSGQLLPISENEVLFTEIGTTYGGDGQSTFALPDFRGRLPMHKGNGFIIAETGGVESVTLTVSQIPSHSHPVLGTNDGGQQSVPNNVIFGRTTGNDIYASDTPFVNMAPGLVSATGGSQPHSNFMPYLCVNFIISLFGLIPSPT